MAVGLLVFAPGYLVLAALFPRKDEMRWSERIAFSFGVSIAVVALLGLLLDYTPFGIRFPSIVGSASLLTVALGGLAYWRRRMQAIADRLNLDLDLRLPIWKDFRRIEKISVVSLAAAILVAGISLVYIAVSPASGDQFTEFYILGPTGNASQYPTSLKVSENGSLVLGIENHAGAVLSFSLRVDLVGTLVVYNTTLSHNETIDVNRTTRSSFNVTLADGQTWTRPYSFSIPYTGVWRLEFLLFKAGNLSAVFRQLHMYVVVT